MEENSNVKKGKILIIFDFDHTILSANSDYVILTLLSEKAKEELRPKYEVSTNWANYMQEVYKKMKEEGVVLSQIKDIVENIPFNPGYNELFELIKSHPDKFDTMIISGANTLFLKWVLEKHGLSDLFPVFYSNWAEPDEELLIKIAPHHEHDCDNCDDSQCKRIILNDHLIKEELKNINNYDKFIFAGDGENDYCLATLLKENDMLFPRAKFPLTKKLYDKGFINNLKCDVHIWEDAYKIIEEVNKVL